MNLKLQLLVLLITISFSSMVFSNSIEAPELSNFAKAKQNALEVINSAEAGDAKAQLKLGMMLTKGAWVKEDKVKAIEWWEKSAKQGNVKAQLLLGTVYFDGKRVKKDVKRADYWFNKAVATDADFIEVVNQMKAIITKGKIKEKE